MPASGMTLVEAAAARTVDVASAAQSLVGKVDVIYAPTDNNVIDLARKYLVADLITGWGVAESVRHY